METISIPQMVALPILAPNLELSLYSPLREQPLWKWARDSRRLALLLQVSE